jgi:hypothetical protein
LRLKAIYHCVKPPFPSSSWTWTAGGKRWKDGSVLCQLPGGFRVYQFTILLHPRSRQISCKMSWTS